MALHLHKTVLDAEDAHEPATFSFAQVGSEYGPGDGRPADGSDDSEWVSFRTPHGVERSFPRVAELPRLTRPTSVPPRRRADDAQTTPTTRRPDDPVRTP